MTTVDCPNKPSLFIQKNIPLFLDRFSIFFTIDGPDIEYCISDLKSKKDISCSIEISMDREKKHIDVLMFYPGLSQLPETRYFSAACFFLVIHHFALHFHLTSEYSIFLRTKIDTYNSFYAHFIDFKFSINHDEKDSQVYATCKFHPLDIDVSMIMERPSQRIE